jgi:O-antigen biosynthesis protein
MKTSIIIPIYNQKDYTQKCLKSVFKCGSKYEFEIIVVDNSSTDDSREYLAGLADKVRVIRNEKNLGFAKACNQGAEMAKGEYLLFLNNDTVVTDKWSDILVDEMDNNKELGIVGPKLLYPNGTVQQAGIVFDDKLWPHHIYKREQGTEVYVNKKRQFQCLTAACFLIKKDLFEKVNGFDEVYLNGSEDMDICFKIRELGFDILYCPGSVVYHYESMTEGRSKNDYKNYENFIIRWGKKIKIDYRDYLKEDGMVGMGQFLDARNSRKFTFKRITHLKRMFFIVTKRDGLLNAIKMTFNLLRGKR